MMNGAVIDDTNNRPSGRAAFTSQQKLRKATEFKRVFNKPFVSSDACFKVLARANEVGRPRLGMAVSRQIDKRAVGRNRIKRVVRESFRLRYAMSRVGFDIVILPRRKAADMSSERLFDSLKSHWARLENQFEG